MPASLLVVVPTLNSHALLLGSTLPPGPLRPRLSPPPIAEALATEVQDLEDRLRIFDALYIPTRYPAKAEPPVCWPVRQLCTGYGVVALKQAQHYLLEDLRAAHARIPAPVGPPFDPDTLQSMDRNLGRFPRDVTPAYILSPSQSEGTYAYSEY